MSVRLRSNPSWGGSPDGERPHGCSAPAQAGPRHRGAWLQVQVGVAVGRPGGQRGLNPHEPVIQFHVPGPTMGFPCLGGGTRG